jgi:hypothetical protein
MSSKYVSRLDPTTYARPKKTKTESVQDEKSIQHYLKDYEEIDQKELPYINPNTHIRYISWDKKNKCELFRFGGLLVRIQPQYVQLAGIEGKLFSAQRYTYAEDKKKVIHMTRFFRKMKQTEVMKDELEQTVEASQEIIQKQSETIEKLQKEMKSLKKKLSSK